MRRSPGSRRLATDRDSRLAAQREKAQGETVKKASKKVTKKRPNIVVEVALPAVVAPNGATCTGTGTRTRTWTV